MHLRTVSCVNICHKAENTFQWCPHKARSLQMLPIGNLPHIAGNLGVDQQMSGDDQVLLPSLLTH